MEKIVALIPARMGSKRVKDKNIKLLNGKPLIAHTIKLAKSANIFEDIIVSTDSNKYSYIAKKFGASVPFLRPKNISGSDSTDFRWVDFTLKKIDKKFDFFCILRPTNPFRSKKMILSAFKKLKSFPNAHSIRAVELTKDHPYKMWKIKENYIIPLFNKTLNNQPVHSNQYASLPEILKQNASLEIAKTSVLKKYKNISGKKILPYFTNNYEGFDINYPIDFELAKIIAKKFFR